MTVDPTEVALSKISSTLDRFQEAHWWIHTLEGYYHNAGPFRWHLNAFLKALKEAPHLLQKEMQNEPGFVAWFKPQKEKLQNDRLLRFLAEQRDYVVHEGMLKPGSHGFIGITEGRGIKLGFSIPIDIAEDSENAMTRYLHTVAKRGDVLGLMGPDEDSLPCVQREWRLAPFDEEVVELTSKAWLTVGEVITATVRWLGAKVPKLALDCRHSNQQVQFKLFNRAELAKELRNIKKSRGRSGK